MLKIMHSEKPSLQLAYSDDAGPGWFYEGNTDICSEDHSPASPTNWLAHCFTA